MPAIKPCPIIAFVVVYLFVFLENDHKNNIECKITGFYVTVVPVFLEDFFFVLFPTYTNWFMYDSYHH